MKEDAVLQALKEHGGFLSGQELSRQLGISRAGIWKRIQALRAEGYEIEAKTNLGYRLCAVPDRPDPAEICALLPGRDPALLHCFDQVDSTNSVLKRESPQSAPDGAVVIADCQTGGRGRQGRVFQSPPGKGLYLSILWRPWLLAQDVLSLTGMSAVAVCNAVEQVCGLRPGIKWTNDVILKGKKLCGILTEMSLEGETGQIEYVIVGIGINVSQTPEDFSPEVAQMATSCLQAVGHPVSRTALAAALIRELDRLRLQLGGDGADYLAAYRKDCVNLGKPVQLLWREESRQATAVDIDPQFGLVVRYEDGSLETIRSGEVSVRGLYGYLS